MQSAFGVDHGEFSKALNPIAAMKRGYQGMSTGAKVATVGASALAGVGDAAYNKKRTGRITGNGGLVGVGARKMNLGYQKKPGA